MPKPAQPDLLLAVSPMQAAAALGIHVQPIYSALQRGELIVRCTAPNAALQCRTC
jgi:hypothetical protein